MTSATGTRAGEGHIGWLEKTLADKLSDKIQVIIAPPPRDGGFIGATLLGAKGGTNAGTTATPRTGTQGEE